MLVLLRAEDGGWGALFFLFGCCWQADNGALFVGSALGRFTSPFLPTVSAKKTWAGAFGALVFSSGSAYLYATLSQEATRADAAHRVDDDQPGSIVAFLGSLVPALPFETPTTAALVGLLLGLAAIVVSRRCRRRRHVLPNSFVAVSSGPGTQGAAVVVWVVDCCWAFWFDVNSPAVGRRPGVSAQANRKEERLWKVVSRPRGNR